MSSNLERMSLALSAEGSRSFRNKIVKQSATFKQKRWGFSMIKILAKSIREYKKPAILTPILVTGEVVFECIIPYLIAQLVNQIQAGCEMIVIVKYGAVLVVLALLSLLLGAMAGSYCATASCGLARNLRKDMFYKIQGYSFENIDKFSVSSLVTRMTTDVTNVQQAFMMIIRAAIRSPLMLLFSFVMGFVMGGRVAVIYLVTIPMLGDCPVPGGPQDHAHLPQGLQEVRRPERLRPGEHPGHAGGQVLCPRGL